MQRPINIRQGDRSEYFAQNILSALGIATEVHRQEDFQGIDFHCTLCREVSGNLQPYAPYNVQIKSLTKDCAEYGGFTESGAWRKHEIEILRDYQTPLFIGVVDKKRQKLDLFQTANRSHLWLKCHQLPAVVRLVPNEPSDNAPFGSPVETPEEIPADSPSDCAPILWSLGLGPPVLSMQSAEMEDPNIVRAYRIVLQSYIALDQENETFHHAGLQQFKWPKQIETNKPAGQLAVLSYGTNHYAKLANVLTTAIASLVQSYTLAGHSDLILPWQAVIPQLTTEGIAGWSRNTIIEHIRKHPSPPVAIQTLQIIRATYGCRGQTNDVALLLQNLVFNNSLAMAINNSTMGGDPALRHGKFLTVIYQDEGRQLTKTVGEGQTLTLP